MAVVTDYKFINDDEEDIKMALLKYGPIAVGMNANNLQFYKSGIHDPKVCMGWRMNHAVLIVGYGIDENGTKYWTVRNSWGIDWGEEGYFRIVRGKGKCGIHLYPTVPIAHYIGEK